MTYSSNLKSWAVSGSEYPDSYSYTKGEQPVDEWDNYLIDNIITDIFHLINATDTHQSDTSNPHSVTSDQVNAPSDTEFTNHTGDSSAHHTKYSDSNARSAVEAGNIGQIDFTNGARIHQDNTGGRLDFEDRSGGRIPILAQKIYLEDDSGWFSGRHDQLTALSSDDHHSKYTDSEAVSAVESVTTLDKQGTKINVGSTYRGIEIYGDSNGETDAQDSWGMRKYQDNLEYRWIDNSAGTANVKSTLDTSGNQELTGGLSVNGRPDIQYAGVKAGSNAVNGHLMLDSNGGNLYLNWDSSDDVRVANGGGVATYGGSEIATVDDSLDTFNNPTSAISMGGNRIDNINSLNLDNVEHSDLGDNTLAWDNSEGGGGFTGGLILQDAGSNHGWVVQSSAGAYDIQKNGNDATGVINFKT